MLTHPWYTLGGAIVAWILFKISRPWWNNLFQTLPSGPFPWPLVGNLLLFKGTTVPMAETVMKMRKDYGDVFTLWFGPVPVIFLDTLESIEKFLLNRPNDIASRPQMLQGDIVAQGYPDIIFAEYDDNFRSNRKVAARALHKALESSKLERIVAETTKDFIQLLRKEPPKKAIEIGRHISSLVFSTIASLSYGKKFEFDDPKFLEMKKMFATEEAYFEDAFMLEMIPGVRNMQPILKYFYPVKDIFEVTAIDKKFAMDFYAEHKKDYAERSAYEGTHSDIVDAVIAENDTGKKTDDLAVMIVRDLFAAGYQTTQRTLRWFFLEMALNPDIQEDLAQHVRKNIGLETPSLSDKTRVPLVEAAVIETLRIHPVSPFGGPRCPMTDVQIGGMTVPKDTWVMPNVYAVHMNPKVFPDPTRYNPERHLGPDGDLVRPRDYIPFGVGRRICMGKQVAENDLFLFCTSILQHLKIVKIPGKKYSNQAFLGNDFNMVPDEDFEYYIEQRS